MRKRREVKDIVITDEILAKIADDAIQHLEIKVGDKYSEDILQAIIDRQYTFEVVWWVRRPEMFGFYVRTCIYDSIQKSSCQDFINERLAEEKIYNEESFQFDPIDVKNNRPLATKRQVRGCKYDATSYEIKFVLSEEVQQQIVNDIITPP